MPLLVLLAEALGKTPGTLLIYDPYFCNGAVARLSRIFLWFEADFVDSLAFARANGAAVDGAPAVRYFEYDWSLNKS